MNVLARLARAERCGAGLGGRPPVVAGLDEPRGDKALSCDRVPGRASRGGGWNGEGSPDGDSASAAGGSKVVCRGGIGAQASASGGAGWEIDCGAEASGAGGDAAPRSIAAAPNALPPDATI